MNHFESARHGPFARARRRLVAASEKNETAGYNWKIGVRRLCESPRDVTAFSFQYEQVLAAATRSHQTTGNGSITCCSPVIRSGIVCSCSDPPAPSSNLSS